MAHHRCALLLALPAFFAGSLQAQVTGSIVSFNVTNYSGSILAGDTGAGGRQAIQTSTVMLYTNQSLIQKTNVFQLAYQLVDKGGVAAPILDEKGHSNVTYSVYQTNILPTVLDSKIVKSYSVTNNAPLQPFTRLDPYNTYMPQLKVYSGDGSNNPVLSYTGANANGYSPGLGYLLGYLDFTNSVSPDASPNILAVMTQPSLGRVWSIGNSPGQTGFPVQVGVGVSRYDDFTQPPHPTNTTVTLNFQLLNAGTGAPVPLQSTQAVFNVSIQSNDGSSPPNPVSMVLATNFSLVPVTRLDSVDNTYQIVVTLAHTEGSKVVNDHTSAHTPTQLFDFNGQLYFGSMLTYFTNLDAAPVVTNTVSGDHLDCLLKVSANAGLLPGAPGESYGDGNTTIAVALLTDGTAQIKPGSMVNVQGPLFYNQTIQNISFQTYSAQLTSTGAVGGVTVVFPIGFSLAAVIPNNRLSVGALQLGTMPLTQNLAPATNLLTIPGPMQVAEETLPYWFYASSGQWDMNSGTLTFSLTGGSFTRQIEDDLLTNNIAALNDANLANRVSNDGYFRNATVQPGGSLVVTADGNGVARVSCQLGLNPTELRPHFPYSGNQPGQAIQFTNGSGSFVLQNGAVAPASFLPAQQVPVSYARDCKDTNCNPSLAGPGMLVFTPTNNTLGFTADGGLLASGSVPPANLTWGYIGGGNYAQEVLNVQQGTFEMAGTFLDCAGQSFLDSFNLPAVLLFAGFGNGASTTYHERPGEAGYPVGLASYPGLNFVSPVTAISYIAGQSSGSYSLAADSKYYVRYGGVSGIHDTTSFPTGNLHLCGYNFTFTSYRLSYLDSLVDKSLTSGAISFPAQPSGFTQEFTNMLFTGRGYLKSAEVPASSGPKKLAYWNTSITPLSIEFAPTTNDVCGTGQRFLVLGVETQLPLIPHKLHATLGFKPSGDLVTLADGVSGCDSRFAVPAHMSVQRPGSSCFELSTVGEGYFNSWSTPHAPASGFYNLTGKLRVPFFKDVKVHLHITPSLSGDTSKIAIMGGWPAADSGATDVGWNVGTSNYFNTAKFDPSAQGFPSDQHVKIDDYESSGTVKYHPLAYRDWIKVATFNYSLQWDSALFRFTGFEDGLVDLPLFPVHSRLKELTPGKVDFDFAQDVTLQLPRIKALDFVNDAINEVSGPLLSVSNAVQSAMGTTLDTAGLGELQGLLREDPTALFKPVLNAAFSPVVDQLYTQLANYPQKDKKAFLSNAVYLVNHSGLSSALNNLNGIPGQANSIVGKLDNSLGDAQKYVNQFINILGKGSDGSRNVVSTILQQLVSDQGPLVQGALGALPSLSPDQANSEVASIAPALDEIQSEFKDLNQQLGKVHGSLTNATGHFHKALAGALSDANSVQQLVQSAANNVSNHLYTALTPSGDYFTANPDAAKQAILKELINGFHSSPIPATYQQTLREFLFDDNALMGELMDTTFDQLNEAIRDSLSNLITGAGDSTYDNLKNLATSSGSLAAAKIRGSPTFNGDSLRKIHLNGDVQMNIPQPMKFKAYMEIKELTSQSVPVSCIPAGDPAAEVSFGAKNVPMDWLALNPTGDPPLLSLGAKFTLQSGNVIGVGGSFDLKGKIGFQGCSVNEIGAMLCFGEEENYISAKAAGTVTIIVVPVDVDVGVFVGKACTLEPILFIDPHASDALGANNVQVFNGIYVQFGATLSLSEILFGTSSCFLDLGATESVATYYTGTADPLSVTLGQRQFCSLEGSVLCIASASASLDLATSATYSLPGDNFNLNMSGNAELCASILFISGCLDVGVTASVGTGGITYDLHW